MNLNDMISLCESKGKTIEEYKAIRDRVMKESVNLNDNEQEIIGDALENLEMLIEWS